MFDASCIPRKKEKTGYALGPVAETRVPNCIKNILSKYNHKICCHHNDPLNHYMKKSLHTNAAANLSPFYTNDFSM